MEHIQWIKQLRTYYYQNKYPVCIKHTINNELDFNQPVYRSIHDVQSEYDDFEQVWLIYLPPLVKRQQGCNNLLSSLRTKILEC